MVRLSLGVMASHLYVFAGGLLSPDHGWIVWKENISLELEIRQTERQGKRAIQTNRRCKGELFPHYSMPESRMSWPYCFLF